MNTIYKIYTGVIAFFMKDHATRNDLWDDGQLGAREGVLGTVDQLLVDEWYYAGGGGGFRGCQSPFYVRFLSIYPFYVFKKMISPSPSTKFLNISYFQIPFRYYVILLKMVTQNIL